MKQPFSWNIIRWFFKYLSPLFLPVEKALISRYKKQNIASPVFIIGAPRTGSTILYEILTNYLDVSYINNFIFLTRNNYFTGFLLSKFFLKDMPHNYFKSKHGNTFSGGLNAPHECGQYWNLCIPVGIDFIGEEDVNKYNCGDIKKLTAAITNRFGRPLLFKNLNAGMRIALLTKLFPGCKFIFIKRDPLFTAQSILLGRKKVFGDANKWWSVKPQNYNELKKLPYIEQIVKQVYFIEKQISSDLKKFSAPEKVLNINYEQLTEVEEVTERINDFIFGSTIKGKISGELVKIDNKNLKKLNDEEFNALKIQVEKLDWETI